VGGSISGLASAGLVLKDTVSGNSVSPASGATSFALPAVATGSSYAVTVMTQPSAQNCVVTSGGVGVANANVNNVVITCTSQYTIGGTITGTLTGTGLVLKDSVSGNTTTVVPGATSFTITPAVAAGSTYNVSVLTQPASPTEACSVTGGSGTGTANANVTTVVVNCVISTFTVGGTLTGASVGTGLTVKDTVSGNTKIVTAAAGSFTITPAVNSGAAYAVTITAQPTNPTQSCTVNAGTGSGTVTTANVTSVVIHCVTTPFTVGGTIVGYTGSGLVLKDTTNNKQVPVTQGSTTFAITPAINSGTAYTVSVLTQPSGPIENCVVTGGTGSGTVTTANVTSVTVNCAGRYLYITNQFDGSSGSVVSFGITPGTGALTPISAVAGPNTDQPSGIALDPAGDFAYVISYGAQDIDTYSITAGTVATTNTTFPFPIADEPFSILVDPAGANAYVGYTNTTPETFIGIFSLSGGVLTHTGDADTLSGDIPFGMAIDPADAFLYESDQYFSVSGGALTADGSPGLGLTGPYAFAVYPAGGFFYVTDTSTSPGTVNAFAYSNIGAVSPVTPTGPAVAAATVGVNPESVAVDPQGRFLYVANAGDGATVPVTVSGFTIQAGTGALTSVGAALNTNGTTGYSSDPAAVVVDISGQYLYVSNGDAGTVSVFTINQSSGVLTGPIAPSPISSMINTGTDAGASAIAAQ
jgi:trimeric autotransporter adhesin